jgi:hypothetical protein
MSCVRGQSFDIHFRYRMYLLPNFLAEDFCQALKSIGDRLEHRVMLNDRYTRGAFCAVIREGWIAKTQ